MEWYTTEDGKYRIESLTAATFPGALEVMRVAFAVEEANCVGTGLSTNPIAIEELLFICGYVALDGVSLVAVATDTGEVVSVAFNTLEIPESQEPENEKSLLIEKLEGAQEATKAIYHLSKVADEKLNVLEKFGVDCSLEILFLSTLHKHRKQRLGELLCIQSIELARKLKDGPVSVITADDLGPKFADFTNKTVTKNYPKIVQALWSAEGTKKIGKKLNFDVALTISFADFVVDGKTFSERLGRENPTCELGVFIL